MSLETWLLFVVVAIAPVMSPGPGILFSITTALRYGVRTTIIVGSANALGITALGLVVGAGLSVLLTASAAAFLVLKLLGGAYLVYLGVKLLRDGSAFSFREGHAAGPVPTRRLVRQALTISLSNPKATVALAALLPPFLDPAHAQMPQVAILASTYGAMCALNHVGIAYAGGAMRRWLADVRRARLVRRVCAALFVGFGAALVASARP